MNVVFSRVDYAQVGTTSHGCLRVMKEHSAQANENEGKKSKKPKSCDKIVYKTPPGPVINCVCLGGALHTVQDKTFCATRAEVRGFSKKGKQFLVFESNMTEGICSMYIYGVDMFLCGRNSFTISMIVWRKMFVAHSYICADQINDVLCLPITEGGWVGRGITPILACGDKTIKVIEGSHLAYEVLLNEIPNVLHLFMNDGGFNKQKVLYGTRNGKIGLVDLSPTEGIICLEIDTKSFSAVTAIDCYRILDSSGSPDVIVGKEDGLIEIYTVDELDTLNFRQLYQCEESITGMECGKVASDHFNEIVVCTYTGWVFALTTEPLVLGETAVGGRNEIAQEQQKQAPQLEVKVQQLKSELEDLENKVREERDRYQELAKSQNPNDGFVFASIPPFTINDKFALKKELACYTLSVELAIPIDYVLLQSDVKVDLMDVERNSAVVSVTQSESGSGNALLAVYRCQADITRMEMRIRSIEGQFGTLKIYVVPRLLPITCQMRIYPIKPLALHERVHNFDSNRPLNVLTFTGNFSMAEAHSWLVMCVSQIPERCPQEESVTFNFRSTFNGGTIFQASYRDVISKIVTMRQLKVHISCDVSNESVSHTLRLIHPKMEYQTNLLKKLELAKGLKELEATFEDVSYLSPELKEILKSYDQLHEDVNLKSIYFDRVLGIITDLYIDKYKVMGQNVKHKASELLMLLHEDYSLEKLIDFFQSKA